MNKDVIVRMLEKELEDVFDKHPNRAEYMGVFREKCEVVYDVKIKKYQTGEKTFDELKESIMREEKELLQKDFNVEF
ncbi:hypothetical protein EAL2_c15400 [Peptoclostridium acidaminophilum DSM 3953]|uniref:Uncharacterized protein n=1 Tax=Peptoclostridium acidaminophilum DSM 3953 TaxID=1286171 RepID=W8T7G1_PEPAC|nr:hypothetical protein [Peptoclostridium acidaminophilum]AHM56835.1 hypothetical protein EAL2_c15400 [Peptoclostridium acidaminophilum DSM 3953]